MISIEQFIKVIHSAVLSANDALMQENLNLLDNYFESENEGKSTSKLLHNMRAKTVTVQYPDQTEDGVIMRDVNVPLITLIPVSMAKVSEVKFRTDLEIHVEGDDLKVSFSPLKDNHDSDTKRQSNTNIEITVTPQESSVGLKKLIEGYERTLRSQIPN